MVAGCGVRPCVDDKPRITNVRRNRTRTTAHRLESDSRWYPENGVATLTLDARRASICEMSRQFARCEYLSCSPIYNAACRIDWAPHTTLYFRTSASFTVQRDVPRDGTHCSVSQDSTQASCACAMRTHSYRTAVHESHGSFLRPPAPLLHTAWPQMG